MRQCIECGCFDGEHRSLCSIKYKPYSNEEDGDIIMSGSCDACNGAVSAVHEIDCPLSKSRSKHQKEIEDNKNQAQRKNEGKIRYDLLPVEWDEQLAALLTAGCRKYSDWNWAKSVGQPESYEWRQKCLASMRRHIASWQKGELADPDHAEKIHHLTAAAWNALVIVYYDIKEGKFNAEP